MNCEWCAAHINEYLDGELSEGECAALENHFEICVSCAVLQTEFSAILNCCLDFRAAPDSPPNSHALWLRISNLIESEQSALVAHKEPQLQPASAGSGSVSRWLNQSWQLSSQQLASAVLGTVVITALITVVALQRDQQPLSASSFAAPKTALQSGAMAQVLSGFGFVSTPDQPTERLNARLREQQVKIEYWEQRVEQRKRQWNHHLRDAFDRNVRELDTIVAEQERQLQTNPHDEVSEEMLNSALNDKMELLEEFARL